MPLAYVIFWFVFGPKHDIGWSGPLKWLIYPLIYIVYSLIRGAFVLWYPYWFVDMAQLGYSAALTNMALVLFAFVVVGYIYAGSARIMTRTAASA